MLDTRIVCPTCGKRLTSSEQVAVGDRLRCPRCQNAFHVQPRDILSGVSILPSAGAAPVAAPYAPPPTATIPDVSVATMPSFPDLPPSPRGGKNPERGPLAAVIL